MHLIYIRKRNPFSRAWQMCIFVRAYYPAFRADKGRLRGAWDATRMGWTLAGYRIALPEGMKTFLSKFRKK